MNRNLKRLSGRSEGNYETLIAETAVLAGVILMKNGAEIHDVESAMTKICDLSGAMTADAYATPGMLMISFTYEGKIFHSMKRMTRKVIDMEKVSEVDWLIERLKAGKLNLGSLYQELKRIDQKKSPSLLRQITGSFIAAFGFGIMFGATIFESIFAGLAAISSLYFERRMTDWVDFNITLLRSTTITAFGLLAGSAFGCSSSTITIAALMILVPGMLFTTALKEIATGDVLSGQAYLTMSLMQGISIASGSFAMHLVLSFL